MKAMKRLMAALLAVAIMVSAAPVMKMEASAAEFKPHFVAWGADCTISYIGFSTSATPTEWQYKIYDMEDLNHPFRTGSMNGYATVSGHSEKCVKITGGRKTLLTAVRLRARINGAWTAWSGYVGLIPLHTDEYCKTKFNSSFRGWTITWSKFRGMQDYEVWISTTGKGGWKRMTRTTGTSYKFNKWNGASLKKYQDYYIKVIGRAKVGSTMTMAKGNSDTWWIWKVWYY